MVYARSRPNIPPDQIRVYSEQFQDGDTVYLVPRLLFGTEHAKKIKPRTVVKGRHKKVQGGEAELIFHCTGIVHANIRKSTAYILTTNIDDLF